MENTEWTIIAWSLPDKNMLHIVIKNTRTSKEEHKTYRHRGCFRHWMFKHGLVVEAFDLERVAWK